jgi:hypothetical protein
LFTAAEIRHLKLPGKLHREPFVVVIQQCYPLSPGSSHADISRFSAAHTLSETDPHQPIVGNEVKCGLRIFVLAIDHYDYFDALLRLIQSA